MKEKIKQPHSFLLPEVERKRDGDCAGRSSSAEQEAAAEHRRGLLSLGLVHGMVGLVEKGS